ncbi:hypothetical protein IE81DRAFT_325958 [Ceraceosorus guamensis]|uniref:Non-structural maintenance of chromosomes element 4 n=1 Tax=Ceraceosorus guamensis TaxID=1522189 RepID=A0A316VQZ0_9BASI|nr:hypothetical protein IE81DRAFT_325958 [Ceraceosorus guamensis]PWN40027.1 hypothetical protein IE81DRAFT_325958 [Ceraceosorus guamensis]
MPSAAQASTSASASASASKRARYDPEQSAQEKRHVRKVYRDLISATEVKRTKIAEASAKDLSSLVLQGNEAYANVRAPTEGVLDSRFLLNASEMGAQMAKNIKMASGAFDTEEYLARVVKFIAGSARARRAASAESDARSDDHEEEEDVHAWHWDRLGQLAARYSRRAPTLDFLLGPLETSQKERKGMKRARIDKSGPMVAPQELKESDIQQSETETTRMVREVADVLEQVGGAPGCHLFRFVLDPKSFSNSVENLFYVSFLIRDGKASLEDDEETGEPILMAVDEPTEEDYAQGLTRRQLVLELTMPVWEELIQLYDIKESIIPTRKETTTALRPGGWYA